MSTMPPKFNANAREFTPTPSPSLAPPYTPPPQPHHAPFTETPSGTPDPKNKTRSQRHDRPSRRMKCLAAGLRPPPRLRKPRRDPVQFPPKYQIVPEDQHIYSQQDAAEATRKEEEENESASTPSPAPTHPSAAATTHHSVKDPWQRRLQHQHPRAWTSVSGIGIGAYWGRAVGEGYGGLRYSGPRPITGEETTMDYVVERAYEMEEWLPSEE